VVEALDGVDTLRVGNRHLDLARIDVFAEPYEELLAAARPRTRWDLDLLTPTTIRLPREPDRPRRNQVLPLPDLLAAGLSRRWDRLSPVPLGPVEGVIDHHLVIGRAKLRTERHVIKAPDTYTVGSVGQVQYLLAGKPSEADATRLDALWRLAAYAGLGDHTTKGMGVVVPRH
jgi:CRISPR-associated endoribonuclease Cas6